MFHAYSKGAQSLGPKSTNRTDNHTVKLNVTQNHKKSEWVRHFNKKDPNELSSNTEEGGSFQLVCIQIHVSELKPG